MATLAVLLARPPDGAARAWKGGIAFLVVAGSVTALLALPWFLWNLNTFGTPWQVSGAAKLANPQIFGHVPGDWPNRLRFLLAAVWVPAYFVAGETMKQRAGLPGRGHGRLGRARRAPALPGARAVAAARGGPARGGAWRWAPTWRRTPSSTCWCCAPTSSGTRPCRSSSWSCSSSGSAPTACSGGCRRRAASLAAAARPAGGGRHLRPVLPRHALRAARRGARGAPHPDADRHGRPRARARSASSTPARPATSPPRSARSPW